MICLDTIVLVYAIGSEHRLREPCRCVLQAHRGGRIEAATTVEIVQEFCHVRGQRHSRESAVALARQYIAALSLMITRIEDLNLGLTLYQRHPALGAFDALLAALALNRGSEALISADRAFGQVADLPWMAPDSPALDRLIAG